MKELGLQHIPVADIDVSFRLRSVDEGYAAALAENIQQVGRLRQPIEVRKDKKGYRLIAGAHRLAAVTRLEWREVAAFVYEATEDEARLAEIDENLVRHELNPLDRATFLAERKAIYERLHPETRKGGRNQHTASLTPTIGFCRDTASRLGVSRQTIDNAVSIATKLAPDVKQALIGTPLAMIQKELLDLAKLPPAEQRAVLPLVLGDPAADKAPEFKSVRQAHNSLTGRREAPAGPDGYQKLLTAWRHATASERQAFREWLAQEDVLTDDSPKLEAVG